MKIKEIFNLGKQANQELCEDGYVVTDDYAVVIDGAGTPSPYTFESKKGGRFIMELIRESIPKLDKRHDHLSFISELNDLLLQKYKDLGVFVDLLSDINIRPMASIIVYSKYKNELWLFGDCQALVNGVHYTNPKLLDEVTSNARKMFIDAEILLGKPIVNILEEDSGRKFIEPLLKIQRTFLHNEGDNPLSYSAIDGFGFRDDDIKVVTLADSVREIVLASDGYVVLKDSFHKTEEVLKKQLELDPLAIKELKGTKCHSPQDYSFDDRTYLKLELKK